MKTIRISAFTAVFILLSFTAYGQKKIFSDPYFFVQISDPQFGMNEADKGFGLETYKYDKAVKAVNRLKPDFVVITGDLVNNKDSASQITEFKRLTSMINKNIKVWYVPGNHDIGQPPTKIDIDKFIANYGHDRFAFKHKESTFIGLNSCIIKSDNPGEEEIQMKWLRTELDNSATSNHIIVFTHYPFFINTPDEPETYSNISIAKRNTYFTIFNEKGVDAVFAGHLHNNGAGKSGNVEMITTNAVAKSNGKGPSGIRVIKVYPDRIESVFYGIDEIPGIVTFAEKK